MNKDKKSLYNSIILNVAKQVKKTLNESIAYSYPYTPYGTERYNFLCKLKKQANLNVKISWSFDNNDGEHEYDVDVNDKAVMRQIKKLKNKAINCSISSQDIDERRIWHYYFSFLLFVKFDDDMNIIKYNVHIDRGPYVLLDPVDLWKNITKILDNYTLFKRYIKKTEAYQKMEKDFLFELGTSPICYG